MRRIRIGSALVIALAIAAPAFGADLRAVLKEAQESLEQEKFSEAVTYLERALPDARGNAQLLQLLRQAYRGEIQRLVSDGDRAGAQKYLERLHLIEKTATKSDDSLAGRSAKATEERVKVIVPDGSSFPKVASQERAWRPAKTPIVAATDHAKRPAKGDAPTAKVLSVHTTKDAPTAAKTGDSVQAGDCLKQADALFLARRYLEAGELYDKANRLSPETTKNSTDRRAYCQLARVVEEINSQPESKVRWSAVAKDVQAILQLIPGNEFAQSLLTMAERNTAPVGCR